MASRRLPGLASFAILLLLAVAVAADEAFAEEDDDGPALNFSSGEFEAPTDAPDVQADLGGYEYDDEDVFDSRRTEDWFQSYSDDDDDDVKAEELDSRTSGAEDSGLGDDDGEGAAAKEEMEEEGEAEKHHHRRWKRYHHRKSDNETANPKGEWLVDDPTAPQNGHRHAPSCILARFRAHINIPILDEAGNASNKTIVIPPLAEVVGDCGETVQTLTLYWNNTWDSGKLVRAGMLSFLFTRVEADKAIYLTGVRARVSLFLEDVTLPNTTLVNPGGNGTGTSAAKPLSSPDVPRFENLALSREDALLWRTPLLFAYVCSTRCEITLMVNSPPVVESGASDADPMIITSVDPVFNHEAFLVLNELQVESFRKSRFTSHFTHLKYDCLLGWPYGAILPVVVALALVALVCGMVVAFLARERLGCVGHLWDEDDDEEEELLDGGERQGRNSEISPDGDGDAK